MATKRKAAPSAPKGFKMLNARAPIWKPEPGDELQGAIMARRELDAKQAGRQNAKKGEKVRILTVANDDGELFDVWESHALTQLMDSAKVGDSVYLRLNEVKKSGKRRFKDFVVGLKAKGSKT